ncbi:hypothetical protein [Chakrabartyella piscis]|uniref:hypothetical protein n=1 Tax=Chakrabartyella piscis TaxID=2918914 RepID=UPI00295882A7|nr:hypothetical protein [Chakrabartyella piscis]
MLSILFYLAVISGFLFPKYLITAIRSQDEENEVPKNTLGACITFGLVVLGMSMVAAY